MAQSNVLPPSPIIAKLQQHGAGAHARFRGWVGSGAPEGKTRLHLDLNELGYHVEFDHGDVVHSTDVPESTAKEVWLKSDARVRLSRSVRTSAVQISRFLTRASSIDPNVARMWMLGARIDSK